MVEALDNLAGTFQSLTKTIAAKPLFEKGYANGLFVPIGETAWPDIRLQVDRLAELTNRGDTELFECRRDIRARLHEVWTLYVAPIPEERPADIEEWTPWLLEQSNWLDYFARRLAGRPCNRAQRARYWREEKDGRTTGVVQYKLEGFGAPAGTVRIKPAAKAQRELLEYLIVNGPQDLTALQAAGVGGKNPSQSIAKLLKDGTLKPFLRQPGRKGGGMFSTTIKWRRAKRTK